MESQKENLQSSEVPVEYQVFALAFQEPGAIAHFSENLPADAVGITHGQTGIHQFYMALLDCYDRTQQNPIDPITFRSWLENESELYDALGGSTTLDLLMETIQGISLPKVESVTALLRYRYRKRKQLDLMQELQGIITKKGLKSDEDNERISFLTDQIRSLEGDLNYSPLDMVTTAGDMIEKADLLWELPDFLPTQFKKLNEAMGYDPDKGGFCRGAIHAVLAQSGKGKSTFAKCLMNHWVDTGHNVLFVNYEEAPVHWERTLLTQITKHNVYMGMENPEEKARLTKKFQDKMREWGNRFMVRHDPDTPYFEDLDQWLRDIQGHNELVPDVVIIDTIQSMFIRGAGGGGRPRWADLEIMMVRLEKLARDLNCVLIITAQENVNRMKENRDVVKQSDTGGSIAIQQKSSVTIFITEKKISSGDDSIDEYIMELQIPKNRITGSAFAMDPALVRYNDGTKSYEPYDLVDAAPYEDQAYLEDLLTGDIHH